MNDGVNNLSSGGGSNASGNLNNNNNNNNNNNRGPKRSRKEETIRLLIPSRVSWTFYKKPRTNNIVRCSFHCLVRARSPHQHTANRNFL